MTSVDEPAAERGGRTAWPWSWYGTAVAGISALSFLVASASAEELPQRWPGRSGAPGPAPEVGAPEAGAAIGREGAGGTGEERNAYAMELVGVEDKDLRSLLEAGSLLLARRDDPPLTAAGLVRRIEADVERFRRVLRSQGYYDGEIGFALDEASVPAAVTVRVSPGEPYALSIYRIRFVEDAQSAPPEAPPAEALGLRLGTRTQAADLVTAEVRLLNRLRNEGWALARRVDREIVVDHRTRTVQVDVLIDPDLRARFGRVSIEGLDRTDEDYLRQWISWSQGDLYDESKVDQLRRDLQELGLFEVVEVKTAEEFDERGELPVHIRVSEARPRSVGFGVGYSTDRGIGGKVFWRHRNLFGRDEDLEAALNADLLQQSLEIEFASPHLGRRDRRLYATARVSRDDTEAFEGVESTMTAGLRWPLRDRWSASLGGLMEFSDLTDRSSDKTSILFGVPGSLRYGGADDELDPTEGWNLDLTLTPFAGRSDDQPLLFGSVGAVARGYYPIDPEGRFVLAGRLAVGSAFGEETQDVPANQRLYAGGGGSIRGYAFQSVGPLDSLDNPLGGRSRIELSGEVRARVWKEFAVVSFVDAGNVFDSAYPDFAEPLQWAAGLGIRYHTSVGPLRFDIAFPVNRRDGVDDRFQVYFSIGQAF